MMAILLILQVFWDSVKRCGNGGSRCAARVAAAPIDGGDDDANGEADGGGCGCERLCERTMVVKETVVVGDAFNTALPRVQMVCLSVCLSLCQTLFLASSFLSSLRFACLPACLPDRFLVCLVAFDGATGEVVVCLSLYP